MIQAMLCDVALWDTLHTVVAVCERAVRRHGKIFFMGNGGSAADAQHLAAEMVGRFAAERRGLAAVSLTADTAVLTAISNDYGYDTVFARQIEALAQPCDVLVALSTSGGSVNIVKGLQKARERGLVTVVLTGENRASAVVGVAQHCLFVPSSVTARIQEGHIMIGHIICALLERSIVRSP